MVQTASTALSTPLTTGFAYHLETGLELFLRPIVPSDKAHFQEAFARLSPQSRYNRFFQPLSHLSPQQLHYLTEVDQINHVAWCASQPQHPTSPGIAVGRFVRLPQEPAVAEFALTVLDAFQKQGIGTLLLALLNCLALRQDIHTLRGVILPHRKPLLRWLQQLGAHIYGTADYLTHADLPVGMGDCTHAPTPQAAQFGRLSQQVAGLLTPPIS